MSDEDFEKIDDFSDLSIEDGKDDFSNLDEYGVWIKKKVDDVKSSQDSGDVEAKPNVDNDGEDNEAFDFDGQTEERVSMQDDSIEEKVDDTADSGSFDDIDMSDFFTDFESDDNEETAAKEDEVALNMDLNFDNMDSFTDDESGDDFDAMLSDAMEDDSSKDASSESTITEDVEIDDLLSDFNSSPSLASGEHNEVEQQNIDINVDVDEAQDFSGLSNSEEDSSLTIAKPSNDEQTNKKADEKKDDIVVKNTIVEPENIDEIIAENKKLLGEDSTKNEDEGAKSSSFNDVEALACDLAKDDGFRPETLPHSSIVKMEGFDRLESLLQSVVLELQDIKKEIASLKDATPCDRGFSQDMSPKVDDKVEEESEETGFFKDEDTDEAIALTGDELNNILITADFTEEKKDDEGLSQDATFESSKISEDALEACGEDEKNIDDDVEFEPDKEFEFDDIELGNSKLDDFVIPEELDYNMLNLEDEEDAGKEEETVAKTEGADMSYLDEKDEDASESYEDVPPNLPTTQDLNVESKDDENAVGSIEESASITQNDVSSTEEHSQGNEAGRDELPSMVKKDVKSVLSYMDQLLESLPEEKLKEFAESEYFEMYKRLFKELGI